MNIIHYNEKLMKQKNDKHLIQFPIVCFNMNDVDFHLFKDFEF